MCKQSRHFCHGEGAERGGLWPSVAVDFGATGLLPKLQSQWPPLTRVAELAQPFDDIRAGRLERIKDEPSFSVVERDALRPNTIVRVDNV